MAGFSFGTPPSAHAGDLLVTSINNDLVPFFDGTTGASLGDFATSSSQRPVGIAFGPDGHLYVSYQTSDNVVRYRGSTGAVVDTFVAAGSGGLDAPFGFAFGADGHLYVASALTDEVLRYDGQTGAFIDAFVSAGSGGLAAPGSLAFGPDGRLYVSALFSGTVLRYDEQSGAFLGVFASGSGLTLPVGIVFGSDGHLYVADSGPDEVLRFHGTTGAFIDVFVAPGSGGLGQPNGLVFGPDAHLYVTDDTNDAVRRYNGTTGAFIDVFVASASGGLDHPTTPIFFPDSVPDVPGFAVSVYASVTDPVRMSFEPDGTMLVGRDAWGSGGGSTDALKIHRVSPGGSPVVEYGNSATTDPDAVVSHWLLPSGDTGSAFVGGLSPGSPGGVISRIRRGDELVTPFWGPTSDWEKPGDFVVDSIQSNRILFTNYAVAAGTTPGVYFTAPLLANPVTVFTTSEPLYGIAVDEQDRIYVSADDGTLRLYDAAGALVDASVASGLGPAPLLARGRFGNESSELVTVDLFSGELLQIDEVGNESVVGTGFGQVTDLEFGPDGSLYASELVNDRVLRITAPTVCNDGVFGPREECEDGNTTPGDGCFSDCHFEDDLGLVGTAQGGSVSTSILGVLVATTTTAGQTPAQVASALTAQVNGNALLSSLGVSAVALGDRFVTNGSILGVDLLDAGLSACPPVPMLPSPIITLVLAALLLCVGVYLADRGPLTRSAAAAAITAILLIAVALPRGGGAQQCARYVSIDESTSGLGFIRNLSFNADSRINFLLARAHLGLLRPWIAEQLALDITITSLDGTDHFHGTDIIPLSETVPFKIISGGDYEVIVGWTEDEEPEVIGDVYTVSWELEVEATAAVINSSHTFFGPF